MNSLLTSFLSDKKDGIVFKCFSVWHVFYILFFALLATLVLLKLRGKSEGVWNKTAHCLINFAFSLYIADFFLMPLAYGEIDVEKLPFHVCTAMCVACFLSYHNGFFLKYRRSFALLGFVSNLVYLIYPAGVMWHAVHPMSYRVVQTLVFHGVMSLYGIVMLVSECNNFTWHGVRRELSVIASMTAWALIGNLIYNSEERLYNWFFVVRDPFYLLPADISQFVMPFISTAAFFGVEMILYLILIKCRKKIR